MNIRPWLAGGACAATLALVATSGATASTTALTVRHYAAGRGTAPGKVRVKGLHLVRNVRLPHTTLPRPTHARDTPTHARNTLYFGNWSGYTAIAKKSVQLRFVSANFNVPSVNCANSPTGTSGFAAVSNWAGLDGLGPVPDGTSKTVEQAGVTGLCTSGSTTPTYYAWYEIYPATPVTFSGVNPGDGVNVSVYFDASNHSYNLVLNDLTTGSGFAAAASCPSGSKCLNSSAEAISEVPGASTGTVTLADYGLENFTGASVTSLDGVHGNLSASNLWTSQQIVMVDTSGVMDQPSSLEGGQGFSTTWYRAS